MWVLIDSQFIKSVRKKVLEHSYFSHTLSLLVEQTLNFSSHRVTHPAANIMKRVDSISVCMHTSTYIQKNSFCLLIFHWQILICVYGKLNIVTIHKPVQVFYIQFGVKMFLGLLCKCVSHIIFPLYNAVRNNKETIVFLEL